MKHDNVTMYVVFMWNWSKFAIYDDAILHHASPMHLKMRFDGLHMKKNLVLVRIYGKYHGVLGLLMAL
jgi:hypothetical protein